MQTGTKPVEGVITFLQHHDLLEGSQNLHASPGIARGMRVGVLSCHSLNLKWLDLYWSE